MALPATIIGQTYPLPAYNFRVEIGTTAIACADVQGLSMQYEPITYKHGLSWKQGVEYMPGQKLPVRVTIRKGITKGGNQLYSWIETVKQNQVDKRDVSIHLCNESGQPVVSWQLRMAFPVRIEAPGFSAASGEVAIETLELMAGELTVNFHK